MTTEYVWNENWGILLLYLVLFWLLWPIFAVIQILLRVPMFSRITIMMFIAHSTLIALCTIFAKETGTMVVKRDIHESAEQYNKRKRELRVEDRILDCEWCAEFRREGVTICCECGKILT